LIRPEGDGFPELPANVSDPSIRVQGVTKSFGSKLALDGLSFEVFPGEIFGLLGPNGAGKTTTLRILAGLSRPTEGFVAIESYRVPEELHLVSGRVGVLLRHDAVYPHLSGLMNLRVMSLSGGARMGKLSLLDSLARVGLQNAGDKKVKTYSTGMKQRLGLAAVLLRDPDILLLDEPTLGLDPSGVLDLRRLLRELANDGKTILLSSHQLHEVDHLCQRVLLISDGTVRKYGPLSELKGTIQRIEVRVADVDATLLALRTRRVNCSVSDDRIVVNHSNGEELVRWLAEVDIYPSEVIPQRLSLEELYVSEL
jgi:ABC-2 type transport system ATP-binding protein